VPEDNTKAGGEKTPRLFYGYVIVAAALLIDMIMAGVHFTFGVFFKPVSSEFGWTSAATSGAFTFYSIAHGALYIATGKISDRFGPKPMMIASGLFFGLGFFLMSGISSIWQLYLYNFLIAVGISGGFVPLLSTITHWFEKRRGLMTGLVLAGGGLGQAIFPQIGTWLIAEYDWPAAYRIFGVGILIGVILLSLFLRKDPAQMGLVPYGAISGTGNKEKVRTGLSIKEVIHTGRWWLFFTSIILFQFGLGVMVVHAINHGIDLGMSAAAAAGIVTTFAGVGIAARVFFGAVVDRIGGKYVMALGILVLAVSMLGIALTRSVGLFYTLAAVFGLGFGASISSMSPLTAQLFGLRSHGVIFGVATFGATVGGGLGPLMAGAIFDATDSYSLAFIIASVLSLVAFTGIMFLKVPKMISGT